jgi:hypothetical protein
MYEINQNNQKEEYYEIEKKENNYYCLTLKYPNKELLLSLTKTGLILGSTITDNYQSIKFRASSIKKLSFTNQNYNDQLNIFYCLSKQIHYLIEKENKSFLTLNPDNILIIDNKIYIYLSLDLYNLNDDQNIILFKPFLKSKYNSPELNNITSLPINIHYKTIYFSLAILITSYNSLVFDSLEKEIEIDEKEFIPYNIKNTKLYFALKRCLKKNPEERVILFI